MLKKLSVFWFLEACPSRTSLLGLPYAPRPQRRHSLPSQRGAYGKPGRLVRLGQTPKKSKNAWLFQHSGWTNHCVIRLWFAKHSRTIVFFDILVSPQEMLQNLWVFWLFDFDAIMARDVAGGAASRDALSRRQRRWPYLPLPPGEGIPCPSASCYIPGHSRKVKKPDGSQAFLVRTRKCKKTQWFWSVLQTIIW